ncbi:MULTISPECIES: hypothetical protein [unclassified Pseudomonas]|uniref:hypothetical protein n=1 Tax=unclassified Pseudomonas TaxID=196821 RepID=UPI002AC90B8B|nr:MULTISPECIES: hypothetical protein [unclassified Pseudomonas]MEB0046398.1 hypothetical protein [Pseudomonas sp. Dout3]MEB0097677.1 hypothetical protein [Pseudomonas sp. DC1.2]WPX57734.1 hypothetical protein RHM68_19255 [Pseudomonas sp. DC1.2]
MNNPVVLAHQNLVVNGDFSQATDNWTRHPSTARDIGQFDEFYQGEMTRYLRVGSGASISQVIVVPKALDTNARYVLSFLCEVRYSGMGRVLVEMVDQTDKNQDIPLLLGGARSEQEDRARLEQGQPLAFVPIKYEVQLDLPLQSQGSIRVRVFSPTGGAADAAVCIARIHLALHLPPMELQTLKLDDELLPAGGVLPLCLGAPILKPHSLMFVPVSGHSWLGTQASLTVDDNPLGSIVAAPDWGVDQPLESSWTLETPWFDDEGPHEFTMQLLNQYTAEPYLIPVSLGHHRLVLRSELEAAYYPVLEYRQSVRLGVQVASYYTGQALDARTVTWTVPGQGVNSAGLTDEDGWAYFEYVPTVAGDFAIEATVESLYYASGVVSTTLPVRVLATDPWKTLLAVVEGTQTPWEEKTGYPNRGSGYPVQVRLPADHALAGSEMQLRWSGDSAEQLGVAVSPALESPVPVAGRELLWTLTSEDRLDGRFELSLVCSKLLLPSPKKAMSLARNLVRIGEVREANKYPVLDENESVLLRIQVVHMLVSGEGDPVVNALVDWVTPEGLLPTVTTGAGGWASLLYTPKSAGDLVVTARIRAHEEAAAAEHAFNVKALATSAWQSEVRIVLDNVEVDRAVLGVLCWRGQSHQLKIEPLSGSTLIGQPVTLNWRATAPAIGLVASDIGMPRNLTAAGLEWTLTSVLGTSHSSLFELKLSSPRLTSDREMFGRLIAPDLAEELSLSLDQVSAALGDQTLYPCLGATHSFRLLPHALSPLVGLSTTLSWTGPSPEQLGASVSPPLAQSQIIGDGGALWSLDFSASPAPGSFALALDLPQLTLTAAANGMILAHNKVRIEAWHEAAVDPVVGQESAWTWVRVFSRFTERAVGQVPVKWLAGEQSGEVKTDAEGWSGFAFAPTVARQQVIEAVLVSPYDGYEEKSSMMVTVLASDPWEGVTVSFDGLPPEPWGKKTYFPRRKGNHLIKIMAADNSPLFDQALVLGLTGTGPEELGIRFEPMNALGTARPFYSYGLDYGFVVGDVKDGAFALRLAAKRLARLSPANAMSLGTGSQVLNILIGSRTQQTLDWGQELYEQVTVVSTISGKPLAGITVTWQSPDLGVVTSATDFYGVAKVSFKPITAGSGELTVTVGDDAYSESVSLAVVVNEPREIAALTTATAEGYPGEEVEAQASVVSAFTGQPLGGVEVMWKYAGVSLASTTTDDQGKATVRFKLGGYAPILLIASVRGGEHGWDEKSLLFNLLGPVPVITSISLNRPVIYLGTSSKGSVKVVADNNGEVWKDVPIEWTFAGLTLPPSSTGDFGDAYMSVIPLEPGIYPLSARVAGLESPKAIDLEIAGLDAPHIWRFAIITNPMYAEEDAFFEVLVADINKQPLAGHTVYWRIAGQTFAPTVTGVDGSTIFQARFDFYTTRLFAGVKVGSSGSMIETAMPLNLRPPR